VLAEVDGWVGSTRGEVVVEVALAPKRRVQQVWLRLYPFLNGFRDSDDGLLTDATSDPFVKSESPSHAADDLDSSPSLEQGKIGEIVGQEWRPQQAAPIDNHGRICSVDALDRAILLDQQDGRLTLTELADRATVDAFEQAVSGVPHAIHAQRLFGDPDYFLRAVAADLAAFHQLYDDHLATLPGVHRLGSTLVMKSVTDNRLLPL
jgi:hypothetical protein